MEAVMGAVADMVFAVERLLRIVRVRIQLLALPMKPRYRRGRP